MMENDKNDQSYGNSKQLQRYDFNKARLPEQSRDYQ